MAEWTEECLQEALDLQRQGLTYRQIAARLGDGFTKKAVNSKLWALNHKPPEDEDVRPWAGRVIVRNNARVPAEVAAERDEMLSRAPRDLTALLLGDPVPGRSALERPRTVAPSMIPDPLDRLVYGRSAVFG